MQDSVNPTEPTADAVMGHAFDQTLADMRFMGWATLIYGVLTCLSIIGAIVGVPLIIAAHRFIEGVNRFDNWRLEADAAELGTGFQELGRSFRILKILTIVYLALGALYLVFLIFLGGIGIMQGLLQN